VSSCKAEFDRRGIVVAVVSFAEPAMLLHYQEQHAWPFNMFADPKRLAYRSFRLGRLSWFRVFSLATLKLYLGLIRQGMARENYGKEDIYQAGGDFLLDRAGNLLFAHRSQDPADRPSVEKLLREIDGRD
jgi:peroxiredoxin